MSFDIAMGMDEVTLNRVLASLYAKPGLREKIFRGKESADIENVPVTVAYDAQQAPTLKLSEPSPQVWKQALKADGSTPQPAANAFTVHFPALQLSRTTKSGAEPSTVVALDAICTVMIHDNVLVYNALAVSVDLANAKPMDRAMYKHVVIPRVLKMVSSMLSNQHVPNVDLKGLQFGPVVLKVGAGRMTGAANLAGAPPPDAATLTGLPSDPFYVLLSANAISHAAQIASASLNGRSTHTGGDSSAGGFKASYSGTVTLHNVRISPSPDPTMIDAAVDLGVSANAGVDVLGIFTPVVDIGKKVGGGVVDVGTKVGGGVVDVGKKVGGGVVDVGSKIGGGVVDVGHKIADTFHSY